MIYSNRLAVVYRVKVGRLIADGEQCWTVKVCAVNRMDTQGRSLEIRKPCEKAVCLIWSEVIITS